MRAVTALLLAVAAFGLLWLGQRRFIYLPLGRVPDPDRVGLDGTRAFTVEADGGVSVRGWFVSATPHAAKATLLVFNGNAGNRSYRAPLASALSRQGVNVVLFDYRGFGGSTGSPSESGLYADARAIRSFVLFELGVDPTTLVYFGESLGTAVALQLAIEHPPLALVLRSPFTSLADVGARHYWFLPVHHVLWDRYDSQSRIDALACPLIVIAGDRDRVVPIDLSQALFDRAPGPKRFVTIHDADHNDAALVHGPAVVEAVVDAIDERR